jgi:WD40 repeat protein
LLVAGYTVRLWDVASWTLRSTWDDQEDFDGCFAFAPDGDFLAAHRRSGGVMGSERYPLRLYDFHTGEIRQECPDPLRVVTSLSFSPDGRFLAGTSGRSWTAWDVASGKPVAGESTKHREFFTAAFAPDGRYLAVSRSDLTVGFVDTQSWKEKAAFKWNIGQVRCLEFSPDGMKLAGGGSKGIIAVWDVDL